MWSSQTHAFEREEGSCQLLSALCVYLYGHYSLLHTVQAEVGGDNRLYLQCISHPCSIAPVANK